MGEAVAQPRGLREIDPFQADVTGGDATATIFLASACYFGERRTQRWRPPRSCPSPLGRDPDPDLFAQRADLQGVAKPCLAEAGAALPAAGK